MMFVLEPIHMLANLTTYTYHNQSMAWQITYTIEACISQSICNDLCWLCHGTSEVDCYVCIMKWSVIYHASMARVLISTRGMILCINHCIQCKRNLFIPLLWFVVCVCCVNVVVWMISLMQIYSVDLSAHHCSVDCCIPHFLIEHSLLLAQRASVVDCCICIVYCSWLFIIYSSSLPGITLNNSCHCVSS